MELGLDTSRVMVLAEYYMLVFFWMLNFIFEFETVNQTGFEPGSPGPKVATLTIELHFINFFLFCKLLDNH